MSRHKIVKNMDLEDELDDFDGGEDYDDDGGDNGWYISEGLCPFIQESLTCWPDLELTEVDRGASPLPLPTLPGAA